MNLYPSPAIQAYHEVNGDIAICNPKSKPFGDCSFTNTCLSQEDGIVLCAPAYYLNYSFDLLLAANNRIDKPSAGLRGQI
jgi:hypothetical protein